MTTYLVNCPLCGHPSGPVIEGMCDDDAICEFCLRQEDLERRMDRAESLLGGDR